MRCINFGIIIDLETNKEALKMKNILATIPFMFAIAFTSFSQNEEACQPPKRKVQKTIDKAKKAEPKDAAGLFKEALDLAPENAMVYYEFGLFAYKQGVNLYEKHPNPKMGDKSFRKAAELFKNTLELCDNYHSNCSYYLGIIYYTHRDKKEAKKWFEKFKDFYNEDVSHYSDDHQKRLNDVEQVLKELKAETSFKDNPVPFNPKIVKNVSTKNDEYFPMISPDNEILFYTRKLDRRNKGDLMSNVVEEFTWSRRMSMHSEFDGGQPVNHPFNDGTFSSYGSATLSVDNKEMIICACKDEMVRGQKYRNCDLYVTYYEKIDKNYKWSPLENLGENINTKDGWEAQPTLSADGTELYFTAMRPDTRDNDIFVSKRQEDGSWGEAVPFDVINTDGKDKSPFFHQDSETFYFVSSVTDNRKGVGGTDIFFIRKQADGSWSEPKNIGYPINSKDDEIGLFVSTDGTEAYFSSREGGIWNIYSFDLYEEARPQEVVIVKGDLSDEEGNPVEDAEIEIAYDGEKETEKVRVNGNDGKYAAVVKTHKQKDVMINVKKDGHAFESQLIEKEVLVKGETIQSKPMEIKELELGKPYTINDILYPTASAELSQRSKFILQQFARFLKENKELIILIQGHTDDEGLAKKNLTLSDRRANGVKNYLAELGINPNRLEAKGYGQTQPKVPNTSAENKAKNRRTDFIIQRME